MWRAADVDEAVARAQDDARSWAADLGSQYLGLAQAYTVAEPPGDGAEVFSLTRTSELAPGQYVDTFFDTGHENQTRS